MRVESLLGLLGQFPDIDGLWDFEDYEKTEVKIRSSLDAEKQAWSPQLVELLTQLARVQALQSKLPDAASTLLLAAGLLAKHGDADAKRAQVRFLLEQGRYFGLSMNPTQSAVHFTKAWEQALELGDDFFKVEAALLASISQPPKFQNEWLLKAIQIAEESSDQRAKLWLLHLYVMNGWHFFDFRRFDDALVSFEKALASPHSDQDRMRVLGIRWSIGRAQRALNRFDEALKIQASLRSELSAMGRSSGHVELEIAECLQLLKRHDEAKQHFETAYKELSLNGWYADNKASELSRIQHLSKKK